MTASPAETLADLATREERIAALEHVTQDEADVMFREWRFWSRPEQRAADWAWRWWAMVTGRGFGKNRSGAEWVADRCEAFAVHGWRHQVGLFNRTFGHVKALQITGESGLEAVCERRGHRLHHPSTALEARLQVNVEGRWHTSTIEIHTADNPDQARGRNLHTAHADEVAAWRLKKDAEGGTSFTNLDFALRSPCPPGLRPQGMVTTTPRPIPLIKDLLAGELGATHITTGSMYDNAANLAPEFITAIRRRYEGTRLGAQEIHGLVLEDVYGALWTAALIEASGRRDPEFEPAPEFDRKVVGVDPTGGLVNECGIIVAGRHAHRPADHLRHADVLADHSCSGPPEVWGKVIVDAYWQHGCKAVVLERNYGEEMGRAIVHNIDPRVNVEMVRATESKRARAEPVALMYDQGRVHHVGQFPLLEDEMTNWVPPGTLDEWGVDRGSTESPNRLDALVWALTDLLDPASISPARATSPNRAAGSASGQQRQTPSAAWSPTFTRRG